MKFLKIIAGLFVAWGEAVYEYRKRNNNFYWH
jgi:hypothetical protein